MAEFPSLPTPRAQEMSLGAVKLALPLLATELAPTVVNSIVLVEAQLLYQNEAGSLIIEGPRGDTERALAYRAHYERQEIHRGLISDGVLLPPQKGMGEGPHMGRVVTLDSPWVPFQAETTKK